MRISMSKYAIRFAHSNICTNTSTKVVIVRLRRWLRIIMIGTEMVMLGTVAIAHLLQKTMKSCVILMFDMLDHVKRHGDCLNLKCMAEILQYVVYKYVFFNRLLINRFIWKINKSLYLITKLIFLDYWTVKEFNARH